MMKLLRATAYRLNDMKKSVLIFYSVMMGIFLLSLLISHYFNADNININGAGISTLIFVFVAGLTAFKAYLKMFLQNGISRPTLYLSAILSFIALAFLCAFADSLLSIVFTGRINYSSMYSLIYERSYIKDLLWFFTFYFISCCLGFFITALYYRMNTLLKVVVSAVVPLCFFIGLPILDVMYPKVNLLKTLMEFTCQLLGIDLIRHTANPFIAMGTFLLGSAVLLAITYPLIRRATLKEA